MITTLLARQRRETESQLAGSTWLITFTDLMTLLLTFFVLRLSMLSIPQPNAVFTPPPAKTVRQSPQMKLHRKVYEFNNEFFVPGTQELSFQGASSLKSIHQLLPSDLKKINVAVYADDALLNTTQYPSSWELARAQAVRILRQLIDAGVDSQAISAVGYGLSTEVKRNQIATLGHRNNLVVIEILTAEVDAQ